MWERGEAGGRWQGDGKKGGAPGWPAERGEVKQLQTYSPFPWGCVDGELKAIT